MLGRWPARTGTDFGDRSIPTTSPFTIKLGDLDELKRQRVERLEEFQELTGETYQAAVEKLVEKLPEDLQKVYRKAGIGTNRGRQGGDGVVSRGLLTPDLATGRQSCRSLGATATISLVGEITDLDDRIKKTNGYRTQINYEYWETLALAEQEERTVRAR